MNGEDDGFLTVSMSLTELAECSSETSNFCVDNAHWIVVAVLMVMTCFISSFVLYLLYRNRMRKEIDNVNEVLNEIGVILDRVSTAHDDPIPIFKWKMQRDPRKNVISYVVY